MSSRRPAPTGVATGAATGVALGGVPSGAGSLRHVLSVAPTVSTVGAPCDTSPSLPAAEWTPTHPRRLHKVTQLGPEEEPDVDVITLDRMDDVKFILTYKKNALTSMIVKDGRGVTKKLGDCSRLLVKINDGPFKEIDYKKLDSLKDIVSIGGASNLKPEREDRKPQDRGEDSPEDFVTLRLGPNPNDQWVVAMDKQGTIY